MYCPNCGTRNDDAAVYCSQCGQRLDGGAAADQGSGSMPPPSPGPGAESWGGQPAGAGGAPGGAEGVGPLGVVFFCLPIVGAIMYFIWRDEQPLKAKRACTLAVWGMIIGTALSVLIQLAGGA